MESKDVSRIDAALAAARQRKAVRGDTTEVATEATGDRKPRVSDEQRAAKAAEREAQRIAKKQERELARAERRAAKAVDAPTPHMSKIAKAASKLPALKQAAQDIFESVVASLTRDQITAMAMHLLHFNRVKATERALNQVIEEGVNVRIVGGDPRYFGMVGKVSKAQRIRCYVDVGGRKPVYLFTSDVELAGEEVEVAQPIAKAS